MQYSLVFLIASLLLALAAPSADDRHDEHDKRDLQTYYRPYTIALWGDLPYYGSSSYVFASSSWGRIYANLRDSINAANVKFNIHSGDTKAGWVSCSTSSYNNFETLANSLNSPTILSLGDNDWADCSSASSQLRHLRSRFYNSTGYTKLGMGRPIRMSLYSRSYPEMTMFHYRGVTYINTHITGSYNNYGSSESSSRTSVANSLIRRGFSVAKQMNNAAVMVIMQANIFDGPSSCEYGEADPCEPSRSPSIPSAYRSVWENLISETVSFGKPVVLFHGDYHYYQVYPNPDGRAPNLICVQNPGSEDVGWIKTTVDVSSPEVFSFQHIDNGR